MVAADTNGAPQTFDYDVVIIGAGVGGHGAALHAVEKVIILARSFANAAASNRICPLHCSGFVAGTGILILWNWVRLRV